MDVKPDRIPSFSKHGFRNAELFQQSPRRFKTVLVAGFNRNPCRDERIINQFTVRQIVNFDFGQKDSCFFVPL